MMLILHIFIALASLVAATIVFFRPSQALFRMSYAFIGATLICGIYLVWIAPAKMLHVCISGVIYLVIVSAVTFMAHIRFRHLRESEQKQ